MLVWARGDRRSTAERDWQETFPGGGCLPSVVALLSKATGRLAQHGAAEHSPSAVRSMVDADERQLVEGLKRHDEAAFNSFVIRYQGRVFRLLLRMLGDRAEAEDLAQEVFISVFKSIDGFRGDAALSTWVYRVAANHCRNRLKYLSRRQRGAIEGFVEDTERGLLDGADGMPVRPSSPDSLMEARQTEQLLQEALLTLDEAQRELVVLREVEHLSYEEIMAITGLPEGTVKSRLHRARSTLKAYVERFEQGRRR